MRKILLIIGVVLLMSFSWSGLTSTQCVSFTDIQGAGLTLKSGKSAVTSNQAMAKRDVDSLYAVDDSYYSFAAKSSNQLVYKADIQAPSLGTLGGSGLIYSESGGNGWSACSSVNFAPSDQLSNAWYTDGTATPESGDHLYGNSSGTTNTTLTNNYWYAFNWDGIERYVQVTNNGTITTVVYSGTSCPSSGTNIGISSDYGIISGASTVAVWAYATSAVNTDVTVSVHVIVDGGRSADVNVVISNGATGGSASYTFSGGVVGTVSTTYVNTVTPTSYSG